MKFLVKNIRKGIIVLSLVVIGLYYVYLILLNSPASSNDYVRLTEAYGLGALFLLYVTLLISPLYNVFPTLPYKQLLVTARKSLGISSFFFGLAHSYVSFFILLGGVDGIYFWSKTYTVSIILSSIGLIILAILFVTSYKYFVKKLGPKKWNFIHRFIYLAGNLIFIHALLIGTHIGNGASLIYQTFITAYIFLLVLEVIRFDKYLLNKFRKLDSDFLYILSFAILFLAIFFIYEYSIHSIRPGVIIVTHQHV